MANLNPRLCEQQTFSIFILEIFVCLVLFLPHAKSVKFSFPNFKQNDQTIILKNDSFLDSRGVLQLTKNGRNDKLFSVGRASYYRPVPLWYRDKTTKTKQVTNFTTHFQFKIKPGMKGSNFTGDGITFFLAPFDDSTTSAPLNSSGGCLGLITADKNGSCNTTSKYPFVAVEFDTYGNSWDPHYTLDEPGSEHLGVDVNSVVSKSAESLPKTTSMTTGATANASITYNSGTTSLSVFLSYGDNDYPAFSSISYLIDLGTILPNKVRVGFSAATGASAEIHEILSWDFYPFFQVEEVPAPSPGISQPPNVHSNVPAPSPSILISQPPNAHSHEPAPSPNITVGQPSGTYEPAPTPSITISQPSNGHDAKRKSKVGVVFSIAAGIVISMLFNDLLYF